MSTKTDQLIMQGISKAFPGVKALDDVSFQIISGEVHSLIGQNGAGKSTLMGILNGITKPDTGKIFLNGEMVKIDDPKDAFNLNLSIVHQEFALCNNLTVAENIYLGDEPHSKSGFVDYKKMHLAAKNLLDSINVSLSTEEIVGDLNTSQWQIIEICKALAKKPKFIVMDEPTASLDEKQIDNLFDIINTLKKNGIGIIYISHKLKEIIHISDRITVLKDGKINNSFLKQQVNEEDLIKSMIGENILIKNEQQKKIYPKKPILEIKNYRYSNIFKNINIELFEGEILGLSGLLGSGANELLRSIFGIIKQDDGQISLNSEIISINKPRDAVSRAAQ